MPDIWCIVVGETTPFSVTIDETRSVDALKGRIKKKKKPMLDGFAADQLTLYHINVNYSNEQEGIEKVKSICKELDKLPRLNSIHKLSKVFEHSGIHEETIQILVQHPAATTTPPARRRSPFQSSPELGNARPTVAEVKTLMGQFTSSLRPKIRDFLTKTKPFTTWLPLAGKIDEKTRQFYSKLDVPLINGGPSLLLHNLGHTPNPNADNLFQGSKHQILCNTSGSGKTRLLLEGLCKYWGFYFVVERGLDHIGTRDLQGVMADSSNWTNDLFLYGPPRPAALTRNEHIAKNWISKVLLARWVIFKTFIQEAKSIKRGVLDSDVQRHWLYFQILPILDHDGMDPFSSLIYTCLPNVGNEELQTLQAEYNPLSVLGSAFDPTAGSFIYVLDKAQVAGRQHMGAFADLGAMIRRPVLHPIIKYLSTAMSAKVIVSGTGFSLELFRTGSGIGKVKTEWDVTHATGDFINQGIQLDYISLYLPPWFLTTTPGAHLKTRMYAWLRGRHRFTARYLEEVMNGPWEQDRPAASHKLLNSYVKSYTGFSPLDGDQTILRSEADARSINIFSFQWDKINEHPALRVHLALGIHQFLTRGVFPMWTADKAPLVEYGIARFVGKQPSNQESAELSVTEPLALVAIMRYFEENQHTLESSVSIHFQNDNRGMAFEETILLALTTMLQDQRRLKDIFEFHGPLPLWADSPAQIVTCNPSGDYEAFSNDHLLAPSSSVAFSAPTPQDVTRWLERGEAAWCIPGNLMGPDLMTRLRLRDGGRLLLVVQAKSHTTGSLNIASQKTSDGIKVLIPSNWFGSSRDNPRRRDKARQLEVEQSIQTMLEATNLGRPPSTGTPYNTLRVVAAYPLDVNFAASCKEVEDALEMDEHPLAKLSHAALTAELATCKDGKSLVEHLKSLKRARDELEEGSDERPNAKKKKGKGN